MKQKYIKTISEKLMEASFEFDRREGRTDFFKLARNLIKNDFEIEGYLLILATWNFASFRYAVKEFDIDSFTDTMQYLGKYFDSIQDQTIKTINLVDYKDDIKIIFDTLSNIKGISYTGAPKIMHLKNPAIFIMWDTYIRGEKPKKFYDYLEIKSSGYWTYKKYLKNHDGYFNFLLDMQVKFKDVEFNQSNKTMAKAIDEFNYVNITLPIQSLEKEIRNTKAKK